MSVFLKQLRLGPMENFIYLLGDAQAKECAVVDPAWDVPAVFRAVEEAGLSLRAVILTHHHFDHSEGVPEILARAAVPVLVHREDAPYVKGAGKQLHETSDGEALRLGSVEARLLHTPGHTRGSQCVQAPGCLLTGDTLFIGCCGRVDLPGGDPADLYRSLRRLLELPDDLVVYPGHNYGGESSAPLGKEKAANPYLAAAGRLTLERFLEESGV
ncbi:MAG TPA: MBL fold hydrolase [Elusimicrobia bacterium]|nr:MBL fold hydrolase [Elusimicrobiota bacterium]